MKILSIKGTYGQLEPIPEEQLARLSTDSAQTGEGNVYYVSSGLANEIEVWPAVAETLTIRYVQRPTVLDSGGDIPTAIPEEFHLLLAYMALRAIALGEEDGGLADRALLDAQAMRRRMADYRNRRGGYGELKLRPLATRPNS